MFVPRSSFGAVLGAAYLVIATWIAIDDLRSGGGFLNLRGLATYFVTFPVSYPFFKLLATLGIDESPFSIPLKYSLTNLITVSVFIVLCTVIVYLMGAIIELGVRRLIVSRH
jgi:hypothetical protein